MPTSSWNPFVEDAMRALSRPFLPRILGALVHWSVIASAVWIQTP